MLWSGVDGDLSTGYGVVNEISMIGVVGRWIESGRWAIVSRYSLVLSFVVAGLAIGSGQR
jgi:hypothetical protein